MFLDKKRTSDLLESCEKCEFLEIRERKLKPCLIKMYYCIIDNIKIKLKYKTWKV